MCTHSKHLNEKKLEKMLLENIGPYIDQYLIEYRAKSSASNPAKAERAKILAKLEKLKELYLNDLISLDEYRKDYAQYMERLNQIVVVDYPKLNTLALEKFQVQDFQAVYTTAGREEQRSMWRGIIREIAITQNNEIERIYFA